MYRIGGGNDSLCVLAGCSLHLGPSVGIHLKECLLFVCLFSCLRTGLHTLVRIMEPALKSRLGV